MLSSDLKFAIKLFSLYKKWSHDLGRVVFMLYRENKMIVITVMSENRKANSFINTPR